YQACDMASAACAQAALAALLEEALEARSCEGLTARFSPGYGDLALDAQPIFFDLLDLPRRLGLSLTGGGMMLPGKSVTAITGLRANAARATHDCAHCESRDCPYRVSPYSPPASSCGAPEIARRPRANCPSRPCRPSLPSSARRHPALRSLLRAAPMLPFASPLPPRPPPRFSRPRGATSRLKGEIPMDFQKLLGTRPLFFDGAMGTMLQKSGLAAGEVPESWNIAHPDAIARIHGAYLDAGCDIVKANTFGANPLKMRDCAASIRAGVEIARASCGEGALVALDNAHTGRLHKPFGDLAFEDALDSFAQVVRAGAPGCDIVLIETFSDLFEVKAAVLAAKEHCDLPVVVTLSFDEDGQLLTGATVEAAVALLEGLRVSALGFNCGLGPREMLTLLPRLAACTSIPIAINPNAGLPVSVDGRAVYRVAPAEFAETMRELVAGGAWLIGGCCGTTPEHMRETTRRVREMPLVPLSPKHLTVVSSYAKACSFGALAPLVIGERLNPTGKPRIKQALREGDMETLLREGLAQVAAGAQILDVNVGLPGIDEVETLAQVVSALEGVIDVPLQIDTANPAAIERALRGYAGKALINSVSGKRASMDAVFPL
ncbi:MAG: homocysteine S-methyltransferase family protein, partial [Clostridia bacterium]